MQGSSFYFSYYGQFYCTTRVLSALSLIPLLLPLLLVWASIFRF
jgi:hypothetical protein